MQDVKREGPELQVLTTFSAPSHHQGSRLGRLRLAAVFLDRVHQAVWKEVLLVPGVAATARAARARYAA